MKQCLFDESKVCNQCGECDLCDLNPNKKCDNCGQCIAFDHDYISVSIDEIIQNQ